MKNILGHKSWSMEEIVGLLSNGGGYTCPTLPHYRYDRVKDTCKKLMKYGLVKKTGRTQCGVNLAPTEKFKQWEKDLKEGVTNKGVIKWAKEKQPPPPLLTLTCKQCGDKFETLNYQTKYCGKTCKAIAKRART